MVQDKVSTAGGVEQTCQVLQFFSVLLLRSYIIMEEKNYFPIDERRAFFD